MIGMFLSDISLWKSLPEFKLRSHGITGFARFYETYICIHRKSSRSPGLTTPPFEAGIFLRKKNKLLQSSRNVRSADFEFRLHINR